MNPRSRDVRGSARFSSLLHPVGKNSKWIHGDDRGFTCSTHRMDRHAYLDCVMPEEYAAALQRACCNRREDRNLNHMVCATSSNAISSASHAAVPEPASVLADCFTYTATRAQVAATT